MPVHSESTTRPETGAGQAGQRATLAEELGRLLDESGSSAEFFQGLLLRTVRAFAGQAGAVWLASPSGGYRLENALGLAEANLESLPTDARHADLLVKAASQKRSLWTPFEVGHGNGGAPGAARGLFLAPLLIEDHVAGFLEVWHQDRPEPADARDRARLLGDIAGIAAAYVHREQWTQLKARQQVAGELQEFTRQVHGTLDPREVACLVANEGKRFLGCDQVSVARSAGGPCRVEFVSGAGNVDPRGPLLRAMKALFEAVLDWGEPLVFAGVRDATLPPAVGQALDAYLAHSNSRYLVLRPLRDARQGQGERPYAALLLDSFRPDVDAAVLLGRLDSLEPHAVTALYNADRYERRSLRGLAGAFRDVLSAGGLARLVATVGAAGVLVATLALVPVPWRVEARGELLPVERQVVYAPLAGKVVEVKARPGEAVARGQELLLLEDLDLHLQIEQLGIKAAAAEQRVALLSQQLGRASNTEERNALTRELVQQGYELRKAAAERDVLLQGALNPRRTPVPAPRDGRVVTFDAREHLAGKTVKPGDPLLRVADVRGPWEVELFLPEGRVGAVQEGLAAAPHGALEVEFLLTSQPHRTYRGRLTRDGLGGETVVREGAVVLPARVQIGDRDLLTQLEAMPVGAGVRAKVRCGRHAAGYVWFFDLWEFVFEHVLF